MPTMASSPFHSYSMVSTVCGSSHPVPVVPATTSSARSKAPVRSSSFTASAARSCAVDAESSPT